MPRVAGDLLITLRAPEAPPPQAEGERPPPLELAPFPLQARKRPLRSALRVATLSPQAEGAEGHRGGAGAAMAAG
eukprot:15457598-Alexandrium_andersonii.AAC.1